MASYFLSPDAPRADHELWEDLGRTNVPARVSDIPTLTVIAALPSWGARTWMRQCMALTAAHGTPAVWINTRRALREESENEDRALGVYFISDLGLTHLDDAWGHIQRILDKPHQPRVVVRTLDVPPDMTAEDIRVLTERDLSFSAEEIQELAELNGVTLPASTRTQLADRYRGNAALVRAQIENLRQVGGADRWGNPDAHLDVLLASEFTRRYRDAGPGVQKSSTMLSVLQQAAGLRRATATAIKHDGASPAHLLATFDRLAFLPMGTWGIDEETGQRVFEWSEAVWEEIGNYRSPARRREVAENALKVSEETGAIAMQLFYKLELGDVGGAENIAWTHLRYFLLSPPEVVKRAIVATEWDALRHCPALLILAGKYITRHSGSPRPARAFFAAALESLSAYHADSPFDMLRIYSRQAVAHMLLGQRTEATRLLTAIEDLVVSATSPAAPTALTQTPGALEHLAAEMYMPFWVATQVDHQRQAFAFTRVMQLYANPGSPSARAEAQIALTHAVFLGVDLAPRSHLGEAMTDSFVALESGDDPAARELLRYLLERGKRAPSRTAAEAFVLAVQAIVDPDTIDRRTVGRSLQRSKEFWADGEPSTAIVATTAYAYLVIGDVRAASDVLRTKSREDWFTLTARALHALATDRPADAMREIEHADSRSPVPRARSIAGVVAAVAHSRLGATEAALERLEATLQATRPGLLRVALRFITVEDFEALDMLAPRASAALQSELSASCGDQRRWRRATTSILTPADRANLKAIRNGLTTTQIAQERFVSVNTVRTQVRLLLRKLNVSNRREAVAAAERLGVFDV